MRVRDARSILLCLRYGIGDVVMETPLLDALRRAAPRAHVTALGAPPATELLEGDPRVDEVVPVDRWGLTHLWDRGTAAARREIAAWLDRRGYDLVLDPGSAVAAVREVAGERRLAALDSDEVAALRAAERGGAVEGSRVGAARGWGIPVPPDLRPALHLAIRERRWAEAFLARHASAGARPVALSPVASHVLKQWPAERFATVADWVLERTSRGVLLFRGPDRRAGAGVLAASRRRPGILEIAALHLRKVAALLERCALLVSNDTGLLHVAAAVGTRAVAVFGPTRPRLYLPPLAGAVGVRPVHLACPHRSGSSLRRSACLEAGACLLAERSCIAAVGVQEVLEHVVEALPDARARQP